MRKLLSLHKRTVKVDKSSLCRSRFPRAFCCDQLLLQEGQLDDGVLLRIDEKRVEFGQVLSSEEKPPQLQNHMPSILHSAQHCSGSFTSKMT